VKALEVIDGPEAMAHQAADWKAHGHTIGFVPTMGFLHAGHVSLMERIRPHVDRLVVSIYVNPLQFGPNEDLARYPRDPEGDVEKCRRAGVDVVFMPTDLYPPAFSTSVSVHGLTERLCGTFRPGHFEGVATVCARLFGLTRADVAVFGEKDWQQLQVIRRMVRDLAIPVRIDPGPLLRDPDGLAMSSRNKYLSPEERKRALSLSTALFAMASAAGEGIADARTLLDLGRARLDVDRLDYLEIVGAESLEPLTTIDRPARALVAGHIGRTRLIDNVALR
jgi:pantoate--beta-alanine ligase